MKSARYARIDYFRTDHLHLRDGLRTHALKQATMSMVGRALVFIVQSIGTIILARLLTPNDYGLVTMAVTVGLLLGNFGVYGFTEAIIQAEEISHKQISTLFWINVVMSLGLAVLFVAFSFLVVWFFKEPLLTNIIIVLAISNVLTGLSVQHLALIQRNIQFSILSVNELIATIIGIAVPILLALRGWGYWALTAKWLITPLAITIGAWIICGWRPGLPARGTGVRPLVRYAVHTFGGGIFGYFRKNMPKFLIGRYLGSTALGYYDRGFYLTGLLPSQLVVPINGVALSTFSRLTNDPERYRRNFLQVISLLAFIGMPLSASLCLNSDDVVLLLLGSQWTKTGQIVFALGLSIGVMINYVSHTWLHFSLGTPDRLLRWGIIEFVVGVFCVLVGLSYGTVGIAFAFSATYYILLGPSLWYAGKPIGLKLSSVISALWRYYLSALLAGISSWLILYKYEIVSNAFNELNILIRIIASTGLCLVMYLLIIVTLFKGITPILQCISIGREILKRRDGNK